jgi:glycosyltransferase involved in cell wall biosynthesis
MSRSPSGSFDRRETVCSLHMEVAADAAVVMASHDGARFLASQLESILAQAVLPGVLAIVDDASRDGSRDLIRKVARSSPIPIELIAVDGSGHTDPKSRVTACIMRGIKAVASFDFLFLSDQDDEWLPDRLRRQRDILRSDTNVLLVAGDGLLIDESGAEIGVSLRDRFPPPVNWGELTPAERNRAAIRRPFVTGATCGLRRELVPMMAPVPRGWLFDRWATLVATARDGLALQPEAVIRYRIHPDQLLGDRQADGPTSTRRWQQILARGASPVEAAMRARDVVRRIRPLALDATVRDELSWGALARAAMERTDSVPARAASR